MRVGSIIAVVYIASLIAVGYLVRQNTKAEMQLEIERVNQAAYTDILEAIQDENIDPSDDDAVINRLCQLAGITTDAECSTMLGN